MAIYTWTPFEALEQVQAALPDVVFAKSYNIDPALIHKINDVIDEVRRGSDGYKEVVFETLLEAQAVLPRAWPEKGPELSPVLVNSLEATINAKFRKHLNDLPGNARVDKLYENDVHFADALNRFIPNFEYPDFSWMNVKQVREHVAKLEGVALPSEQLSARQEDALLANQVDFTAGLHKEFEEELLRREIVVGTPRYKAFAEEFANQKIAERAVLPLTAVVEAAKELGLAVDHEQVTSVLAAGNAVNGVFIGKVLGVDHQLGLVYQSIGRQGEGVVLPLDKLSRPVTVGEVATIAFKDGRGQVDHRKQDLGQSR